MGGLSSHDIIKKRHARKGSEAGVDGLIFSCRGAGGHAVLIKSHVLIAEVKKFYEQELYCFRVVSYREWI